MVQTDVIVLGGGAVGENVVDRCRSGGLEVVLVEAELVGGECSYWACMPSKALLRSGEALDAARHVKGAAEAVTGDLDVTQVLARRDEFTHDWDDSSQVSWVEGTGATVVRGYGRLTGERMVEVEGVTYEARHAVVLATGSTPFVPPTFADVRPWTSRDATSSKTVPPSLAIVGGGVVAVEMAHAWSQLGSAVTMLIREGGPLPRHEPGAATRVRAGLVDGGVSIRTGVEVDSAERAEPDGPVTLTLKDGTTLEAQEVLVAAGRRPASGQLGLELVGLEPGQNIPVDDSGRVGGVPWLWACGDVTGRALLTHQGKYAARAVGDAVVAVARGEELDDEPWGRHVATADHAAVPAVVFSDPEVAAIGLTEAQAVDQGIDVKVLEYEIGSVAGASVYRDGYQGWAKMVVDVERQVVIGVTLVGPAVGEMLHAATVMVVGEVPVKRLWHAVPSYPTISEVWLRLLEELGRDSA